MIIFRVSHHHPHRLKRPLQHSDRLTFGEIAIKTYTVAAAKEEDGLPRLQVERSNSSDIQLADLFGFAATSMTPNQLITNLQQWTLDPALSLDQGKLIVI